MVISAGEKFHEPTLTTKESLLNSGKVQRSKFMRTVGSESVILVMRKGHLRWLGRAECKDDDAWTKYCATAEEDGNKQDVQGRHGGTVW